MGGARMNSVREALAQEFKCQHLAMKDVDNLQLTPKFSLVALFIRLLIFLYAITMMVINYAGNPSIKQGYQLTHWAQMFTIITFLMSFSISVATRKDVGKSWIKTLYILQITSTNLQAQVALLYWTLIIQTVPELTFFSVHLHLILFVLTLADISFDQIPCRLIHFIYTFAFSFIYIMFTLVLYWTDVEPAVYGPTSDYRSDGVVKAVSVTAGSLAITFITNTVLCVAFRLRARCLNRPEDSQEDAAESESTVDNVEEGKF